MENRDILDVLRGWAERDVGCPDESWVLLIKEKRPDKVIEVHSTDVLPECSE